jgi:hypothetical protein
MGIKTAVLWLTLVVSLLLVGGQMTADQRPGKHTHDNKTPQGTPAEGHKQTTEGHTHQHPWWGPRHCLRR